MSLQRFAPAAIAAACLAVCASANAGASDALRISGFGTVGASTTDTSDAYFSTPGQPAHGATNGGFNFNPDTKVGVQANYAVNPMFSGTAQVLVKETGKGNWTPGLEWAFAKAQLNNDFSVRAGRIGAPFFMISDYRDVNYANLWVRPPLEVYAQVPVSNFNGADLTYRHDMGSVTFTGQLWGGPSSAYYDYNKVQLKNQKGLNLTAEFESGLTLRFGYAKSKLSYSSEDLSLIRYNLLNPNPALPTLVSNLVGAGLLSVADATQLTPNSLAYANAINIQNTPASFIAVGASWDSGNWIASAEYTKRKVSQFILNTTGWYGSLGYRIGKVTPYVYVSRLKQDNASPANPLNALYNAIPSASPYKASVGQLWSGIEHANALNDVGQKAVAIGARWDAFSSASIKAQFESIRPDHAIGLLYVPKDKSVPDLSNKTVNVLSVTVDFVF